MLHFCCAIIIVVNYQIIIVNYQIENNIGYIDIWCKCIRFLQQIPRFDMKPLCSNKHDFTIIEKLMYILIPICFTHLHESESIWLK